MVLQEAIAQITALQNESGSIKKRQILQNNKDNAYFCKLLYYALNPMMTYKISEQTLRRPVVFHPEITLTMCDIFSVCEELSAKKRWMMQPFIRYVLLFSQYQTKTRQRFISNCCQKHFVSV